MTASHGERAARRIRVPLPRVYVIGMPLEVIHDKGQLVFAEPFKTGAGLKPTQVLNIHSTFSWPRMLQIRLNRVPPVARRIIIRYATAASKRTLCVKVRR